MSNIPEGYQTQLWSITFAMTDEFGELLTNEDGSVRLFRENDIDWSFLDVDEIDQDLFYEVNESGDPL
jgi:hypothetical protein